MAGFILSFQLPISFFWYSFLLITALLPSRRDLLLFDPTLPLEKKCETLGLTLIFARHPIFCTNVPAQTSVHDQHQSEKSHSFRTKTRLEMIPQFETACPRPIVLEVQHTSQLWTQPSQKGWYSGWIGQLVTSPWSPIPAIAEDGGCWLECAAVLNLWDSSNRLPSMGRSGELLIAIPICQLWQNLILVGWLLNRRALVFRKMQRIRMIPQVDTCRRPKPVEQSLMMILAEAIFTLFRLPKSTTKFPLLL
jgi:hypothetical protein